MIFYNPLDGDAYTSSIPSNPKHCFLMTRLGTSVPAGVQDMRDKITSICEAHGYRIIDAASTTTGRDFLLKIWKLIASSPVAIGLAHEDIPEATQANIYYELGVAQALGKETIIIKSPSVKTPSDFVRTEYIKFDDNFKLGFAAFLESLNEQAKHYELVADQLDRNPILALDYLKRAFLLTGEVRFRDKAKQVINEAGINGRAKNSVEMLAANF